MKKEVQRHKGYYLEMALVIGIPAGIPIGMILGYLPLGILGGLIGGLIAGFFLEKKYNHAAEKLSESVRNSRNVKFMATIIIGLITFVGLLVVYG